MSESAIQSEVCDALKKMGYIVLVTSARTTRQLQRTSAGVPDVLVTHRCWPVGMYLGLELKAPKGALTERQKALLGTGRIVIVRSLDEALTAVAKGWPKHGPD